MIRFNNVCVRRGHANMLHDLTVEIPLASITAIVGRSGAGKTTLLDTLNGLLFPHRGDISVDGIGQLNAKSITSHQRQTATVFQDHALIGRLSVFENVLLGLADRRHPLSLAPWPADSQRLAAQTIQELDLLSHLTTRVDRLSGGEKQRVGLARALVRKPRILLGDEPFSSIDQSQARQFGKMIKALSSQGMTIVLVLHQLELALSLADRIIGLSCGRVAFNGSAEQFDQCAHAKVFSFS